jgi:hypothetical protein
LCRLVLFLEPFHAAQCVQALRHVEVLGTEQLLAQGERPLTERQCLPIQTHLGVHRAEQRQHRRLDIQLTTELLVDSRGATIQQILRLGRLDLIFDTRC